MSVVAEQQCQNAVLRCLPDGEFAQLRPLLERVPLRSRRVLHLPNMPTKHVYFVESGLVSVLANAGQGRNIEVWPIGPEGVAGFPVMLGERSSPHRRVVQVSGHALRMRSSEFKAAVADLRALRSVLLEYIQAIMIQTSQLGACNATHGVQQRMARWLIMAQDRCQTETLPLTHDMLSRMIGVRRATISRCVLSLEATGVISSARSLIRIHNRSQLEEIACVCYGTIREADEWLMIRCGNYGNLESIRGK